MQGIIKYNCKENDAVLEFYLKEGEVLVRAYEGESVATVIGFDDLMKGVAIALETEGYESLSDSIKEFYS